MFFDKEAIKANHNILAVADQLGIKLTKKGDQWRGECPSGNGGDRAFVITPSKASWYSFGVNKGGDLIAMVQFVKDCSFTDACRWLTGDTEPEKKSRKTDGVRERSANTQMAEKPSEGFRPLEYLQPEHDAVAALGFDTEDAKRIGAGYSPRGVLRGTVAIPVRDATGKLLGYVGARDVVIPKQWHW